MSAPRSGSLVDVRASPAEARRLLTAWAQASAAAGSTWDPALLAWAVDGIASGLLDGRLWVGAGGDEAVGVALATPSEDVGARLEVLHLSEGFRQGPAVRGFLRRLDGPEGFGQIVELPDTPPQVDAAEYGTVARGLGFVPVERADMRYPPGRPPPSGPSDPGIAIRPAAAADAEALAALTVRAYADNPVDTALFRRRSDPMEDARAGMAMIFGTSVGAPIPEGSFLAEDLEGVVGATLANDHHGALITQVMVDPRARKRGLATRLLGATVAGLRSVGRDDIRLVVTRTNRRAERLYESLGFVLDPTAVGANWLHPGRLGLSEQDLGGA